MSINGIKVDVSRGFDVLRGSKLVRRCESYEEARALAAATRGGYVRYWAVKGS